MLNTYYELDSPEHTSPFELLPLIQRWTQTSSTVWRRLHTEIAPGQGSAEIEDWLIGMKEVSNTHAVSSQDVLGALESSDQGLSLKEAQSRLERLGRNVLPREKVPGIASFFLRQFLSPLIYILLLAAVASVLLKEWSDAIFIFAVLVINAVIGTIQEYSAQRSAEALRSMVRTRAQAVREGEVQEVDSEELVLGDMVLLESGAKVPADLRLVFSQDLAIDESLLTGESLPERKDSDTVFTRDVPLGDRVNMAFAGTIVTQGRGKGVVVATGTKTAVGSLAASLSGKAETKPPLLIRMEQFNYKIAIAVAIAVVVVFAVETLRGEPIYEVFLQSVALAVAAIPEGLPVALTIALAIGMRRMAKRNVIVRRLVAVESLGSCSFIASDKTGTLTMNELTVKRIDFPGGESWEVTGTGASPEGAFSTPRGELSDKERSLLYRIALASVLPNEGFLGMRDGAWVEHGDTVDVALLVMAHKAGVSKQDVLDKLPLRGQIPFESERQLAATLNESDGRTTAFIKGAPERIAEISSMVATPEGDRPANPGEIEARASEMAAEGYRVLAVASGDLKLEEFSEGRLRNLTFLGLIGMIDPPRPEARAAVDACKSAGIQVSMVTGDHPSTALSIARDIGIAQSTEQVATGEDLRNAGSIGPDAVDSLTSKARVFARVEPQQKVEIVNSLVRQGNIVAVTGDGANDGPALHAAHVGVAMGKGGTDVARESADLIITDDNFASLVAGVEEGRIVYSNIRKVIFFSISTGAAEIVLFGLALFANVPLPLLAVQLLWLNLVTNGIQDVSLAFEPSEEDEMRHPPRPPGEPIFNRLMIEKVALVAIVIGGLSFAVYYWLLSIGWSLYEARNSTMLLMVLFENVQVFNSRSELGSAFRSSPLRNPLLLFGTIAAQMAQIGAMYIPGLSDVLRIEPVSFAHWLQLLGIALTVLVASEAYKAVRRRGFSRNEGNGRIRASL